MSRILFLFFMLLAVSGCSPVRYNPEEEMQQDAIRAAEFEQMKTDEYRNRVEQSQRNAEIRNTKTIKIQSRRYY